MNTLPISQAPNTEYLELNFVKESATGKGNNTQFIMENLHDGTFQVIDGRVGITVGPNKPKRYTLPIDRWESVYSQKINRGFLLTKQRKMEKKVLNQTGTVLNGQAFAPLPDKAIDDIVKRLISYANEVVESNYSVQIDDISEEMVAFGQNILQDLSQNMNNMSVAEFNNKLKSLYAAIPRRIDNLSKVLVQRKMQFNDVVANEQDLFDIMVGQLRFGNKVPANKNILECFGLTWRSVTQQEEAHIKTLLGGTAPNYVNAWRIENEKTRKAFDNYCLQEQLTLQDGITELFHGSRSENFWSIISNGLTINPSGVVITGKMFGNGTYFAPLAAKSIGYTSRNGSKWAQGNAKTGFLAIYEVTTKKQYHPKSSDNNLNWTKLQQQCKGAHCTWARTCDMSLYADEVIVYQNQQSTIKYLIEVA